MFRALNVKLLLYHAGYSLTKRIIPALSHFLTFFFNFVYEENRGLIEVICSGFFLLLL